MNNPFEAPQVQLTSPNHPVQLAIHKKVLGVKCCRSMGSSAMHAAMIGICAIFSVGCFIGCYIKTLANFPNVLQIVCKVLYLYIVLNYLSSWLQCIFVNPGTPPMFQIEEHTSIQQCNKCNRARPARCHHCSVCDQCCLRYDHHCPWVANCIGLYNHAYFIKYLSFGFVGGLFSFVINVLGIITGYYDTSNKSSFKHLGSVYYLFSEVMAVICSALMFKDNYQGLKHNETQLEIYSNILEKKKAEKSGQSFVYPYDKGLKLNTMELFGDNPLVLLLLPFWRAGSKMTGFEFSKQEVAKL